MLYDLLLCLIVCSDMLLTAGAYGMAGIRMSLPAALILSGIGAAMLTAAMLSAQAVSLLVPLAWCRYAGSLILAALGVFSIVRSIRPLRKKPSDREPHFLEICLDTSAADADHSQSLSWKEAALLALALSLDSVAAGFGAGLQSLHPVRCGLLSLGIGFFCVILGQYIGKKLRRRTESKPDWCSGLLLILLALMQLYIE
ncbi:MAG: manganese efflux pump [Ruminococcus sp.]|nr:manganese efflux pump [Ruminococcus sp.]